MYLKSMLVSDFIKNAESLWEEISVNFRKHFGFNASLSEIKSWRVSYPELAAMLQKTNNEVKGSYIFLEYGMPGSSSRADIMLVGSTIDKHRSAIIIELKQWNAKSLKISGRSIKIGKELHNHPSDQALGYRNYLVDLSYAFSDKKKKVKSCSYLFKTKAQDGEHLRLEPFNILTRNSPLFTRDEEDEAANWINSIIQNKPDIDYLRDLENDQPTISKNLFGFVAKAVRENPAWELIDEQRTAYTRIIDLIKSSDKNEKHLIFVLGGPGTGKSIIAAQLMGELSRLEIPTVHITNSSSFTTVMKALITKLRDSKWGATAVNGLFKLSHGWVNNKPKFDVAICDEAHRFRKETTMWRYNITSKEPQAKEILENVRVMVAFIDEKQILRLHEEGTVENFKSWAKDAGVKEENIHEPIELKVQFRCAGNDNFVKVLDKALFENKAIGFCHNDFEIRIHDTIKEMDSFLQKKIHEKYSARIVAGFCWEWSKPDKENNLVEDVKIDDWKRPWNRMAIGSYTPQNHPYTKWANRTDNQLSEIGCIYSVQGFEFDYIGVIWGDDLVNRNGIWKVQKEKSFDKDFKKAPNDEKLLRLFKNAYRVLTSRGIKGCNIYCSDKETKEYLIDALMKVPELYKTDEQLSSLIT